MIDSVVEDLFTQDYVAENLLRIVNTQEVDAELSFIDSENKSIAW